MHGAHTFDISWDDLKKEKQDEILEITETIPECFKNKPVATITLIENMDYRTYKKRSDYDW